MNLSTPQYVLPDYVCPFAVRVPYGLSLADFLGSLLTHAVGAPRRDCRSVSLQLLSRICLGQSTPLTFNGRFRQSAVVSLLRLHNRSIGQ